MLIRERPERPWTRRQHGKSPADNARLTFPAALFDHLIGGAASVWEGCHMMPTWIGRANREGEHANGLPDKKCINREYFARATSLCFDGGHCLFARGKWSVTYSLKSEAGVRFNTKTRFNSKQRSLLSKITDRHTSLFPCYFPALRRTRWKKTSVNHDDLPWQRHRYEAFSDIMHLLFCNPIPSKPKNQVHKCATCPLLRSGADALVDDVVVGWVDGSGRGSCGRG